MQVTLYEVNNQRYALQEIKEQEEAQSYAVYRKLPEEEYLRYYLGNSDPVYTDNLQGDRWLLLRDFCLRQEAEHFIKALSAKTPYTVGDIELSLKPRYSG